MAAAHPANGDGHRHGAPGSATARDGPDLQEIQTDQLGFAGLNRDSEAQIQLLPEPWPAEAPPPPSASLLAVASSKGIVAAAGPNHLVLATTDRVRTALQSADDKKVHKIRAFEPNTTISKPRLSHVVFSSTDDVLVVSSQDTGGIEAYQLSSLLAGNTQPPLTLSTHGVPLRALVPNPNQANAALMAAVTNNGDLLLANLEQGALIRSDHSSSPAHLSGVSCVSWSNKGKQLVAGLANGTAVQLKPDGSVMAEIPRPTAIPDGYFVSTICWLKDDSFFFIYTPVATDQGILPSEYYIISRRPESQDYTFQKLPEVLLPFGMERIPTHHFLLRLRAFPPHLQDVLILSATSASDVGLITNADEPLSKQDPVTGDFTVTVISNDGKRAQLPLSERSKIDTSPIGMALDLSSKDPVPRPIPSDEEIQQTSGPCPNVLMLNNEGILLSWWLIYDDSVRQKTIFSGFNALAGANEPSSNAAVRPATASLSATATSSSTPFPQSNLSQASPFAAPSSTFAPSDTKSTFGATSTPSFGQSSTIGSTTSSWASTGFANTTAGQSSASASAQPAFGSPSALGGTSAHSFTSTPAFGRPAIDAGPAFGKPSFGAASSILSSTTSTTSPFAAAAPQTSGFAAFSGKSGFAAAGHQGPSSSPFASGGSGDNTFNKPVAASPLAKFAGSASDTNKSPFGKPGAFKLQSSFKKADPGPDDDVKAASQQSSFNLDNSLSDMLDMSTNLTSPTHDKEETMEDGVDDGTEPAHADKTIASGLDTQPTPKIVPQTLVTPPSTLGAPKATPAPPVSDLFGTSNPQSAASAAPANTGFSFAPPPTTTTPQVPPSQPHSTTPKDTPFPAQQTIFRSIPDSDKNEAAAQTKHSNPVFADLPSLPAQPSQSDAKPWQIKKEVPDDDEAIDLGQVPLASLPPDAVSKPRYLSGDTSASSDSKASTTLPDDAPLPPDFLPSKKSPTSEPDQQTLPSQDDEHELSDGFETSGEEVDDISSPIEATTEDDLDVPSDEHPDHVQTSPESSFKSGDQSINTSPSGGLFTNVSMNTQKPGRPLFGEVGSTGPILPPPKPQESPRSPSPVRRLPPAAEALRSESVRSVSAPAGVRAPLSMIEKRRLEAAESSARTKAKVVEEMVKQKAQQEALAQQQAEAAAKELDALEDDDEGELLRRELEAPIQPSETLADFITYQSQPVEETSKTGIPAQIERLYQDVNRMIDTVGLNSRALTAYMLHLQDQQPNESWPSALTTDTPLDVLNDEWLLSDIPSLQEGYHLLEAKLNASQIDNVAAKLQQCQTLLAQDLLHLRTNINSIRKSLHIKQTSAAALTSSLSAEQTSVQQDLRKASASVRGKLAQAEDALAILRAKLAEAGAVESESKRTSLFGRSASQKKPTVEAVMNTITKMTHMAETKRVDVDLLEAQLRKLKTGSRPGGLGSGPGSLNGTPKTHSRSLVAITPGSGRSSVYHTPASKLNGSVRSMPGRQDPNVAAIAITAEDRVTLQAKARRKKEAAAVLRAVLADRRKQAASAKA
ncbi:hypothetical protein DV736_g5974, partial [Chaetothyriales sp. CBS 134916]